MLGSIYRLFFKLRGWKVVGEIPKDLKKFVMVVAPHTSNWDFMVGLGARSVMGVDTKFAGKKELFKFPYGWIFRALGGYPVDRSKNNKFVDAVCDIYDSKEKFSICLTPEGTRSYAPVWKTGFWHIANKLNIPIVMIAMNYQTKRVVIEPPLFTSGDLEKDIAKMQDYFRKVPGYHPELGVR
jgi:1-acyl-sn-glycerol-3-phosphate acyltransferase